MVKFSWLLSKYPVGYCSGSDRVETGSVRGSHVSVNGAGRGSVLDPERNMGRTRLGHGMAEDFGRWSERRSRWPRWHLIEQVVCTCVAEICPRGTEDFGSQPRKHFVEHLVCSGAARANVDRCRGCPGADRGVPSVARVTMDRDQVVSEECRAGISSNTWCAWISGTGQTEKAGSGRVAKWAWAGSGLGLRFPSFGLRFSFFLFYFNQIN